MATCKACDRFMYFGDRDTCQDCIKKARKFQEWKDFYQKDRGKNFSTRNKVMDVFFRGQFSIDQTAEILQMGTRDVQHWTHIIRQDAR